MKLKRFLTLIALLILTMILLTGCMEVETTAKISMKFDNHTITLNSNKGSYVYLKINVKDGEYEETFQKKCKVFRGSPVTISIEDIVEDFFSENAQISNVTVIKTTKPSFLSNLLSTILFLFVVLVVVILAAVFSQPKKTPK